ncbi:hypothetical protein PNOK_0829300 [Pyrrhoderma noxium]|uniref:Uncharacterized protein n=1 Tax=Pyrrhoderma noxium TaxID=2282107 RepID=A0A286UAR1_9AGAM|nr:hypothetical protein PNOK_0829300 [Pyrrhoderma noxium]
MNAYSCFQMCAAQVLWYWISSVIVALITCFGLQLRIYALYQGNKRILALFITTSVILTANFAYFLAVILSKEEVVPGNLGSAADEFMCYTINLPPIYTKGYSTMRKCNDKKNGIVNRLTVLLVKDSALYFFVVLVLYLISQLVWIIAGEFYLELPIGISLGMGSILSQHLLVNIRIQASERPESVIIF